MSNEITVPAGAPRLPAEVSTEIRTLSTSPARYLADLPIEKTDQPRPANAISLANYKRGLDRRQQLMYLGMMITEVNGFFNVRGNMDARQITLTAELILDNPGFYDLTLGNIKACFRHKMATARLYDRLDGNIIIGWLREFKSDMADYCESVRTGQERTEARERASSDAGCITHAVYLEMLADKANQGDKDAQAILADYAARPRILSEDEQKAKDFAFLKFKEEYIKNRTGDASPAKPEE